MMGRFFFAFLLASASGFAFAGYSVDPNVDDGIDYDRFRRGIEGGGLRSLEESLALLPPRFLETHVLVYRSRSLQDSSYIYPRVIAFGRSGKFIVTFNGHEKQRGYNKLEIVQFREAAQRFEFREITFQEGKAPSFSEANPKKCLECHQSAKRQAADPRPNWEPYNFWPGVYGSVDDEIRPVLKEGYEKYKRGETSSLPSPMQRFQSQDMILVDEQAREETMLKRFQEQIKPNHPRYRILPVYSTRSPLDLTKITVILNMRRVARLAREELGPLYAQYKFALAGLGGAGYMSSSESLGHNCGDLYLPESVRQSHLQRLTQLKTVDPAKYVKPAGYGTNFSIERGLDLIFEPLGISTQDWSMDFKTGGRFSFEDRYTSPHDSNVHLREALKIVDPELAKLTCEELKKNSEGALSEFERSGELAKKLRDQGDPSKKPERPLIERCIGCHVDYDDPSAPNLPFDDLAALKPLLGQKKYARGTLLDEIRFRLGDHAPNRLQMPPSGVVDKAQRDQLLKMLESLAER